MKPILLFVIGLVFGTGFGTLLGQQTAEHDHGGHAHPIGPDGYDELDAALLAEWPEGLPVPQIDLDLTKDPKSGHNLRISAPGFTFTPEAVNGEAVPGQGHGHLYINNIRVSRVYSDWIHLTTVPDGEVVVRLTLNADDHRLWRAGDRPIFVEETFVFE